MPKIDYLEIISLKEATSSRKIFNCDMPWKIQRSRIFAPVISAGGGTNRQYKHFLALNGCR
jgi:hypothetical protein